MPSFRDSAQALEAMLDGVLPDLSAMSDDEASARWRGEGTWSRKEILGHLIDSAVNNHQRFIRATIDGHYEGPGYKQVEWVQAGAYQSLDWGSILRVWHTCNLLLAHVLRNLPAERLSAQVTLEGHTPVTLSFVAEDYVTHAEFHLKQILG